jgi:hypothetical protein
MTRKFVAVLFLAVLAAVAGAQERFVKPVDEAAKDASFLAFRTKLIAAAERRDVDYIMSIVDPRIKLGFGGEDGIANFKRQWKLASKTSGFWKEFLAAIKNGGAFEKGRKTFMAPYTFTSWPDDIDGFEYHAIFGNNVNLREAPATDSRVVGRLSYNIVSVDNEKSVMTNAAKEEDREFVWYKVKTLGGKEGFVKSEFVRSHIDYRAGFTKKRGVWKLDFFVAGD